MAKNSLRTGSCLCKKVTYSFPASAAVSAHHCHCVDCQKSTGSGKATIVLVLDQALKISGEIKYFSVVGSDGNEVNRGFCEACGSPLISSVEGYEGTKFIKAGSLDDSSWVTINSSFWSNTAMDWSPLDQSIDSFKQNVRKIRFIDQILFTLYCSYLDKFCSTFISDYFYYWNRKYLFQCFS
jgi:hypothetical protein